jgi:glycosyltransferase involved in cell wall biosynthesis
MNAASKESHDASSETEETAPIRIGLWRGERDPFGVVDAVIDRLPSRYSVHEFHTFRAATEDQARADLDQVDLAWFEWTEHRKLHLSEYVGTTPMVCRVHPDVAYGRRAKEVRWSDVDQWVFPAPGLEHAFKANHRNQIDSVVIPTGLDVDRIPFDPAKKANKNIALYGPIHPEDNILLLFQVMEALVAQDDGFHLHVTGAANDEAVIPYLMQQVKARSLEDHVHFYGAITAEERASWLNQCSYVLSTRPLERDWTGIFEAMARGLKPVIHHYHGAAQSFAPDMLFDTVAEAVALFVDNPVTPAAYRAHAEDHYAIDDIAADYVQLFDWMASNAYPERVARFFAAERAKRAQASASGVAPEEQLAAVHEHLQNDDLEAAAVAVERLPFDALTEDDRLEARVLAVELALEEQRYTDALFHADAAMDLAPEEPMVVHLAGQALWLQGDPQSGADALVRSAELLLRAEEGEASIRFAMDESEAYMVAGEICEQYEQYDAAQLFFEKANQHDPENTEISEAMERVTSAASLSPQRLS